MRPPQAGFTLFELMVGIAIAGILMGLAVPSFQEYGRNARVIAAHNDLSTALHYSRSEAIRRAARVSLCPSSSFTHCGDATAWPSGWFAFVDDNADGQRQEGEAILRQWQGPGSDHVAVNAAGVGAESVTFTAMGRAQPAMATKSYVIHSTSCQSGTAGARRIQVNGIGAVRNNRIDCP